MLAVASPFPFPGSTGFVDRTGEQVRILRLHPDGTVFVSAIHKDGRSRTASDNYTIAKDCLHPTREAAIGLPIQRASHKKPKGRT